MPKTKNNDNLYRQILPFLTTKGDLRKMDIVRATIKCIAEKGIDQTNYETIGQAANMKRAHVAYHFPDKDELILSAIRYVFVIGQETVIDHLKQAGDKPEDQLKAYIEGTFAWLSSDKSFPSVLALTSYLSAINPLYRQLSTEFKQIGDERICALLSQIFASKKKAAQNLAEYVHTYIGGRCIYWLSCQHSVSVKEFAAETYRQVQTALKAMR